MRCGGRFCAGGEAEEGRGASAGRAAAGGGGLRVPGSGDRRGWRTESLGGRLRGFVRAVVSCSASDPTQGEDKCLVSVPSGAIARSSVLLGS